MTTNESKQLIRLMMRQDVTKSAAFAIVQEVIQGTANDKIASLERFGYELNAEEQRRSDGDTTER